MKKIYNIIILFSFILISPINKIAAQAQVNLALSAVATAFTTDPNGLYNWNTINDGNYGTCGTQQAFIWNSTVGVLPNQYMAWTWTSAKTINKIVIHHAQDNARFLTGGEVQYWDGSS